MIAFEQYSRIKDNYCIGYFGSSEQLLRQLLDVRPFLENSFPGLKIYIACRDQLFRLIDGHERVLKMSELKAKRDEFGQLSELAYDGINHPIPKLLKEIDAGPCPISFPMPPIF